MALPQNETELDTKSSLDTENNNNNKNNQANFYSAMTSPQTILERFTKLLDLDR